MDLEEFLREKTTYNQINRYLSYRIEERELLDEGEYNTAVKLYNNIEKLYKDIAPKTLQNKIKKLIIISKNDEDDLTSNIITQSKEIKTLSKTQTYENLKTLINSRIGNIFDEEIQKLIYKYISYNINKKTILNLTQSVDEKLKEKIHNILENNYNIDIKNIYKELDKDKIEIENLEEKIIKFNNRKNECDFCYLNITLVKKTIEKILEKEILNKTLFKGQYERLKYMFLQKIYSLIDNSIKNRFIKKDIDDGKIKLDKEFPSKTLIANIKETNYPIIKNEKIITIDDSTTLDLDGAFSIKKVSDMYILNIFITDVPDFLVKNRKIMKEAYKRGTSIYSKTKEKQYTIDMLPPKYAYNILSLNTDGYKNAIQFSFIFNKNGILQGTTIKKSKIKIDTAYTPNLAQQKQTEDISLTLYKELIQKACEQTEEKYLKQINTDSIESLNSFSSILVNYYIGHNSEFAIYKNNGIYTRNKEGFYTNSVNPLRKYVSDINLMFFLAQIGIGNYPNKYLYEILDNINEIINHLNEREMLAQYMSSNPKLLKKYIK